MSMYIAFTVTYFGLYFFMAQLLGIEIYYSIVFAGYAAGLAVNYFVLKSLED